MNVSMESGVLVRGMAQGGAVSSNIRRCILPVDGELVDSINNRNSNVQKVDRFTSACSIVNLMEGNILFITSKSRERSAAEPCQRQRMSSIYLNQYVCDVG